MEALKRVLTYVQDDVHGRPVFVDQFGGVFKDTSCGEATPRFCTVTGDGEPDIPVDFDYTIRHEEVGTVAKEHE